MASDSCHNHDEASLLELLAESQGRVLAAPHAATPVTAEQLIGPPGAGETIAQVDQVYLRDLDAEGRMSVSITRFT